MCSPVKYRTLKTATPPQPKMIKVPIYKDIDCLTDVTLCNIIQNFKELEKYICELEANPSFEGPKFCAL